MEKAAKAALVCDECHGTGEVLPSGPSDAPVEFCRACLLGQTKEQLYRKVALADRDVSKIHVGTSCLTRDLVWCECGRGLSLSGKWLHCPTCGRLIDQESYHDAVEQAKANGAALYYPDPETSATFLRIEAKAALADRLLAALKEEHCQPLAVEYCPICELIGEAEALGEPK